MNKADRLKQPMYSAFHVFLATIIGTPLAGAWLLHRNHVMHYPGHRVHRWTLFWGLLATLTLFFFLWLSRDASSATRWFRIVAVYVIGTLKQVYGSQNRPWEEPYLDGGETAPTWKAAGVGLIFLCGITLVLVIINIFWPVQTLFVGRP
jgi:hypothetical protein